jgi:hypothetical protein
MKELKIDIVRTEENATVDVSFRNGDKEIIGIELANGRYILFADGCARGANVSLSDAIKSAKHMIEYYCEWLGFKVKYVDK